jgi:hypothetical protein
VVQAARATALQVRGPEFRLNQENKKLFIFMCKATLQNREYSSIL